MIRCAKESYISKHISTCNGDQKKVFNIVNSLLGRNNQTLFPQSDCDFTLASSFLNSFFSDKILDIRTHFTEVELPGSYFNNNDNFTPIYPY